MKTFLWGSTMSVGLLVLAACGGETPAEPKAEPTPVETQAALVKAKVTATIVDPTLLNMFLIVPSGGDTGGALADGTAYEIRSKWVDRVAVGDGDGVLVRVPAETAAQLNGRKVKVTVTARSSAKNGSPAAKVMYFRPGTEHGSGWQDMALTAEFTPFSFEYDVPATASTAGVDNIGFWADPEGKGRGIEVSGVTIETTDQ